MGYDRVSGSARIVAQFHLTRCQGTSPRHRKRCHNTPDRDLPVFGSRASVEGYSLHDMRGTLLCPDVVLVAYWIERTSKSTGAFASNSIWVKRTGNWLRLRAQETPMPPPPSNPGDATRSLLPSRDEWQ